MLSLRIACRGTHVRRPTRKMRLTNFCNRLPKRAPHGLPDSRVRATRSLAALVLRRPVFGPWPSADPQVELRLTATLQLQRGYNLPGRIGAKPRSRPGWDPARSWRSLDRGSSALSHPAAAFSTASRARSVASGALCRGSSTPDPGVERAIPTSRSSSLGKPPGPTSTVASSKGAASSDQDAFHRQVPLLRSGSRRRKLSLPASAGHAQEHDQPEVRDPRSLSPYPQLCHRGPASDAPSPPERTAEWLDPSG